MLCGISPAFAGLFPIGGQIAHVLRTRAPCAHPYCYGPRTRLACVKHAASVRSEPGSNSRLKPVAWGSPLKSGQQKSPGKFPEPADPSKIVSRSVFSKFSIGIALLLEQARPIEVEQILAHRINCQRAFVLPPLSSRVASNEPTKITKPAEIVNTRLTRHSRFPHVSTGRAKTRVSTACFAHAPRASLPASVPFTCMLTLTRRHLAGNASPSIGSESGGDRSARRPTSGSSCIVRFHINL